MSIKHVCSVWNFSCFVETLNIFEATNETMANYFSTLIPGGKDCSSTQTTNIVFTAQVFETFQSWLRTSSNDEKKIQNVNVFIISSINSIFGTGKFPSYSWTVARKYHRNELTFHMFLHAKREDIRPHLDWNVKIAASFLLASEIAFPPIECWWEEKNVPQFTLIKFRNWIAFDLECWLLFSTTAISCVTGAAFAAVLFIKYEMFEN